MKKIFSLFATIALALGFSSCSDNWSPGSTEAEGEGSVSLASLGVEVSQASAVVSRGAVDLSPFIVTIKDAAGTAVKEWSYSAMPELFTLPVGNYTVEVASCKVQKAAWDAPLYLGKKTFTIADGQITEIGVITCKLANIKVTIEYTDDLRAKLGDDVKVTVVANDEGTLDFVPSETRAGYFEALEGSSTLVATFTGTISGESTPVNLQKTYTDVEGGQWYKITYSIKPTPDIPEETGGVELPSSGLTLDSEIEEVEQGANVDVSEENLGDNGRPSEGDPDPGTGPGTDPDPDPSGDVITFSTDSPGFNLDGVNPIDLSEYKVKIHAENGIAHLLVNISSTNADFNEDLSNMGIPLNFDLAYPGELATLLGGNFKFPIGDEVINQKDVLFNISEFIPALSSFEGTHSFTLTVTDNNGIQLGKTLKFLVDPE